MAVESAADRSTFVNPDEFAVTATYGLLSVDGIFDNPYVLAAFGGQVGVTSSNPTFLAPTANLPGINNGDTLVIGGSTYTVRDVQHDGTGFTLLELEAP